MCKNIKLFKAILEISTFSFLDQNKKIINISKKPILSQLPILRGIVCKDWSSSSTTQKCSQKKKIKHHYKINTFLAALKM